MGLLDEAIREHLELKRRSGADPSAVAREEREVLAVDPVEAVDGDGFSVAHDDPHTNGVVHGGTVAADGRADEDDRLASISSVGQDTAEIDMRAVMEEDLDVADGGASEDPRAAF